MGVTITAPVELASRPQWVAWRYEQRAEQPKPTKVPYNARSGARASSTDPRTWATFEEACAFCVRTDYPGVGYVLSPDDPYVGIDLDKCRDPHSGRIELWAKAIVRRINSYTEISPSQTGLRIFIRGALPPHGRKKGQIEVYSQARFLTVTGDRYMAAPDVIHDRLAELLEWHAEVFGPPEESRQNGHVAFRSPVQLADADLLLKARGAVNGGVFWALWNGDYSAYTSQSEADLALLNHLAFWTGPDPARLDGLFRASGLMREKWERPDYRDRSIDKALDGKTEFYGGESSSPRLTVAALPVAIPGQTIDLATGEVKESAWQSLGELVSSKPETVAEAVAGVLWRGRTHWVYSSPGAGKTIFVITMLMHVAAGKDFCGRAVQQCPVILIEEDSPFSIITDYVTMLADIYGFDLDTLPFWINRQQGFRLSDPTATNAIIDALMKAPQWPGIVALDACERILPSDRFSSKELDPLSLLLQRLAAMNTASVVIDHTRKSNGQTEGSDPLDMLYGGRTKSAISDVMMYVSGRINNSARVTFTKFRGQTPAPFDLKFDPDTGFSIRTQRRELTETERKIMRALNDIPGSWMTYEEIAQQSGMSARTVERPIARLVTEGMVDRSESKRPALFQAATSGVPFSD